MFATRVRHLALLSCFFASLAPAAPQLSVPVPLAEDGFERGVQLGQTYRAGLQALVDGKIDEAEDKFRQALAIDPNHVPSMLGRAEAAIARKDLDAAVGIIETAIKVDPESAEAHESLGRIESLRGQYSRAEALFKRALTIDPGLVRARMDLADLYTGPMRKPRDAIVLYKSIVAEKPEYAAAHYALAVAYFKTSAFDRANAEAATANRLDPSNPLPLMVRAHVASALGNADDALNLLDRALKLQPGLMDAHQLKVGILMARGDGEAAVRQLAAAIELQPDNLTLRLTRAAALQMQGKLAEAVSEYREMIAIAPEVPDPYNNGAWYLAGQGKELDLAESWARKALSLSPAAPYHDTLAWVLHAKGDRAGALAQVNKAIDLDPADQQYLYHLATLQAEGGDKSEARRTLRKALDGSPRYEGVDKARELLTTLQ